MAWPQISGTWGAFTVYDATDLTSEGEVTTGIRLQQTFNVRLWEPGDYETPETFVGYRPRFSEEVFFAPFTPIFFTVPSVLDQTDLILRPSAPPITLFYLPAWLVASLTAATAIILWLLRRLWRRHYSRVDMPPIISETAGEIALRDLRRLNDTTQPAKAIIEATSHILRAYLKAYYDINALEATTWQTIMSLHESGCLNHQDLDELSGLLHAADVAKFAGDTPSIEVAGRLLNRTYRWIQANESASHVAGLPDS
ncbi:DUF4381 family protein [bacterium]|nr:DUF4381 family protein [bacterium]